jgi:hypothetical protein
MEVQKALSHMNAHEATRITAIRSSRISTVYCFGRLWYSRDSDDGYVRLWHGNNKQLSLSVLWIIDAGLKWKDNRIENGRVFLRDMQGILPQKLISMNHSLYSAFGKSLCTYKRFWKWCPWASIQAWARLILFAHTLCRSAIGRSLYAYKRCWKYVYERRYWQPNLRNVAYVHNDFPNALYHRL